MGLWLSQAGHQVKVISSQPYYPNWIIKEGYKSIFYKKENIQSLSVYRCPIYVPKKPNGVKRILHLLSFTFTSFPILVYNFFWKPDLIICVEPTILCSPAALFVSKFSKCKTWLHIQDFEFDAALSLGIVPSFIRKFLNKFENSLIKKFDKVSTISKMMKKKLLEKGINKNKQVFFPNWSNLDLINDSKEAGAEFRNINNIDHEDFIVLYSGNIGKKQGLEIVINAAKLLHQNKNIKFIFCGDGAETLKIKASAKEQNLKNCIFLSLQPIELFNKMLNAANVHLVIQKSAAADLVMPSKITNIMASGGFSIVTAESSTEMGELFSSNKHLGIRINPGDANQLAKKIQEIFDQKTRINSSEIRNFAQNHFDIDKIMIRIEKEFKKLIKHVSSR